MLLLTGFEPFTTSEGLKLKVNPTAEIVTHVAQKLSDVSSAVLPVSYKETKQQLTELFENKKPNAWIGLGYAPHRTTLDIEVVAVNLEHGEGEDNSGEKPWMRPIIENAPLAYQTHLDVPKAIEAFSTVGINAQASFHAGTFLCNQVFYLGCHLVKSNSPLEMAAFIHVPPMKHFRALEEGLTALIQNL